LKYVLHIIVRPVFGGQSSMCLKNFVRIIYH